MTNERDPKAMTSKPAREDVDGLRLAIRLDQHIRDGRSDLARVHTLAMAAKQMVFKAQDATNYMPAGKLVNKLIRRLAKVRAELEALDRDVPWPMKGGRS